MSPQVGGSRGGGAQGLRRECGGSQSPGVGDPGPAGSAPRESADKVVLHTGKYEELIVCSHEIAASTAQLVAASKVRLCPAGPLLRSPLLAAVEAPHVARRPRDGVVPWGHPAP